MLKKILSLLACSCALLLAQDTGRVAGAELVAEDGNIQQLFVELLGQPIDQEDVDLFDEALGPMETWASAHREAWNSIEGADEPLPRIYALDVWGEVDVSPAEFVALLIKLSTVKEVASGSLNTTDLKNQVAFFTDMATDMSLPEQDRKDAQAQVEAVEKMIEAINHYPEANLELYRTNQAKIDAGLARFEVIGDDGGSEKEGSR